MRFIHTADWHLGKLFGQRYMTGDQAYVLAELVDAVRELGADAVIIAGDIYDRSVPPAEAVTLFDSLAEGIVGAGAKLLFISGNHDSSRRLSCYSGVLAAAGIHVRGRLTEDLAPVVLDSDTGKVAFALIPYLDPLEVREVFHLDKAPSFDEAAGIVMEKARAALPAGIPAVAVAHAFIAGGEKTDSVRTLSVGGSEEVSPARFSGYDYVALGHLHGPQRAGGETIRYSGSPLCYSFDEVKQKKGFELVDIDGAGHVTHEFHPLTPRRTVRIVEGFLDDLRRGTDPLPKDDYVLVRLLDKERPLSAREKLAEVYENIFSVEYPELVRKTVLREARSARESVSDLEKFADFYREMKGEAMTEAQKGFFTATIDALDRESRTEKERRESL